MGHVDFGDELDEEALAALHERGEPLLQLLEALRAAREVRPGQHGAPRAQPPDGRGGGRKGGGGPEGEAGRSTDNGGADLCQLRRVLLDLGVEPPPVVEEPRPGSAAHANSVVHG